MTVEITARLQELVEKIQTGLLGQPNDLSLRDVQQALRDAIGAINLLRVRGTNDEQYDRLLEQRKEDLRTIKFWHDQCQEIRKVLDCKFI